MRTKTGISGLDKILGGGMIPGSNMLIEGPPGTGKTTFGIQFLYQGATELEEPGIYVTFEEHPEQIYRDALHFGWDLRKLEEENKLRVICTSPELIKGNFRQTVGPFAEQIRARRIVVDSITHLQRLAVTQSELREIFYQFISGIKMKRLSAFLIKEEEEASIFGSSFEEFIIDSIVRLSFETSKWHERLRFLEVLKSRGHESISGKHMFRIGPEGIVLFPSPRISEEIISGEFPARISTGIPGLDEMIGGGLLEGTSTVVAGGPGVGRTTFCLQFLCEGIRKGEPAFFISFHEKLFKIYAAANFYGLLDTIGQDGMFEAHYFPPAGLDVNELFSFIEKTVKGKGIKRFAMDSLTNLEYAIPSPSLLGEYLYNLLGLFELNRVTSVLTYGVIGAEEHHNGHFQLPMVIDNVVLLYRQMVDGKNKGFLSVLKIRMSKHEREPREFKMTDKGIIVCT